MPSGEQDQSIDDFASLTPPPISRPAPPPMPPKRAVVPPPIRRPQSPRRRWFIAGTVAVVAVGLMIAVNSGSNAPTTVRKLAQSYVVAEYADRYLYVHDGASRKQEMTQFYADMPPRPKGDSVTIDDLERVNDHAIIATATLTNPKDAYRRRVYLKDVAGRWLVDWPATVGWNPISLKTFKAITPRTVTRLRVYARFDDHFPNRYYNARGTHYSVSMSDGKNETIWGFVEKQSKTGDDLRDLLYDGKYHEITLDIQSRWEDGSYVDIIDLVSKDWFYDEASR